MVLGILIFSPYRPLLYVADALKPANVIGIQLLDEENKACRAIVNDDQYSLAIGKEAQNVNLAVRLTGWKIDIKSVSDAEAHGYTYQLVEDLKFMEQARKARQSVVNKPEVKEATPIVETKPVEEEVQVQVEVKPVEQKAETPVVEVKPVEVKPIEKEEKVVKPTKSKTPNMFSELEAALNASASSTDDAKPTKKKWKKATEEEEEKVEYVKKTTPSNVLPVYTEEELRALAEEEEAEEAGRYDDDIDYDEFDEYYDEEF